MKKNIILLLFIFTTSLIFAQNDCCQALNASFTLGCIDNLTPCTPNVAPCNDATYDMLFYSDTWDFFACGPACPDPGTCGSWIDNIALPVRLTSFFTQYNHKGIEVKWTTASEVNNEGFYLELSQDGREWSELAFIRGNRDSFQIKEYSYVIQTPFLGVNHVRLKQQDYDGGYEYSPIRISIWQGAINQIKLAVIPNPSIDFIVPLLPTEFREYEKVNYEIRSLNGELIKSYFGESIYETKLDVSTLSSGTYILTIKHGQSQENTMFIKR